MRNYFYLAKPMYGGWVSFTAHLLHQQKEKLLFRVGKKLESNARDYGYGLIYQNVPKEAITQLRGETFILALDKHYYKLMPEIKEATIVLHDSVELKESIKDFLTQCKKIIVIRQRIKDHLKEKFNLESEYKYHPFYPYLLPKPSETRQNIIAMSRVDWDKHTDVMLEANKLLENKIQIYGAVNSIYQYQKLDELDFSRYYKGIYPKDWNYVADIYRSAKFMVDLTMINKDGGGTQYTFLEAIYQDVALILNRKWVENGGDFKEGYNCYAVSDAKELADLLKSNPYTEQVTKNAKQILDRHIKVQW